MTGGSCIIQWTESRTPPPDDDEKGQEQDGADLKSGFQLRKNVGGISTCKGSSAL